MAAGTKDEAEIDRIIKEIEDLEKKMDEPHDSSPQGVIDGDEPVMTAEATSGEEDDAAAGAEVPGAQLYALPQAQDAESDEGSGGGDSLAETDAVPASREPLLRSDSSDSAGSLGLKIAGCTEVSLEFARGGLEVTLVCDADGLSIRTDQGAEFRIPFKKAA
jgi:hypothetical protein